ncbi:hypothetical protein LMG29542_08693 [Paraburkholderia humisilvae]|uniref:Uncharacterized protein n=1 Tax=Paraburkholderia humisilvae TaxID=627669 RepID=A0A6J5FC07_9BURK|nr:hypothetical protein LMG29542_08693 [Paraburkholderia humisilvae]
MRMETWMASQPGIDRGALVRAVVIHHQMDVQLGRHVGLDGAQKPQEFTAAMTPMQFANDFARGDVQRCEQCGRAVAHVVVRASLRDSRGQRQHGLGAVQGLDLALPVHAQHHGLEWRVQIQPDDIAHLVDEKWISGELEGLLPMRLQSEGTPDPRHSHLAGHCSRAPVSRAHGHGFERACDDRIHLCVPDRPRCAGARCIGQPVHAVTDEARTPLRNRMRVDALSCRDRVVVEALGASQHNTRSQGKCLCRLAPHRQRYELFAFLPTQNPWRLRSSSHRCLAYLRTLQPRLVHNANKAMNF